MNLIISGGAVVWRRDCGSSGGDEKRRGITLGLNIVTLAYRSQRVIKNIHGSEYKLLIR